eukprot:scaffold4065_cov161-Skeletonema_dohrnii-CCMP3373.AAC.4
MAECVLSTERHGQRRSAAAKDAQIKLSMEECARGMEQSADYVALRAAQIKSSMEVSALGTEQRSDHAAAMDAQTNLSKEECA